MKKFLTIAMSFMLIVCLSVLATGCTMKVKGKKFAFDSVAVEINTSGLTAEEKAELIENISDLDSSVTADMTDAQLTEKYNANETIKTYITNMLDSLKTETMVFGKTTITNYEDGEATEDKTYYKQDGKTIVIYEDAELTKKLEVADSASYKINDKNITMVVEIDKGIFATFTLKQV